MFDNQNYPWYLQQSPRFNALYNGVYPLAVEASPLDIRDFFNVDTLKGTGLLQFGRLWGLRGMWGGTSDGLIYTIDLWSKDKVWSGQMKDLEGQVYRNFIKMKAYIQARPYSLTTLKQAMALLLDGMENEVYIEEGYLSFEIHVTAEDSVLSVLWNMSQYDEYFLGKPSGISYKFVYKSTSGETVSEEQFAYLRTLK